MSNPTEPPNCVTVEVGGHGNYTTYCLTAAQIVGLAFTTESGMISLVAVVVFFGLVIRNVQRHRRAHFGRKWRLIQRPMDVYMLVLLSLDFFQALGAVFDIKWANKGRTYVGSYCTAQGAIQQFGEAGSAIMTMIITIHTFLTICRFAPRYAPHLNQSIFVAYGVAALVYLFLVLWVSLGVSQNQNPAALYITPTPYWCWLGSKYLGERIAGEYIWLWLTVLTSFLVYVPLSLWSRGTLEIGERWWQVRLLWTPKVVKLDSQRKMSLAILVYPVAYTVIVLPLSIIRWITFADAKLTVPSGWTFLAVILFGLSGVVNVLLLRFTRPGLLLFSQPYLDSSSPYASRDGGSRRRGRQQDRETATDVHGGRAPSVVTVSRRTSITVEDGDELRLTPPEPAYDPYDVVQSPPPAATLTAPTAGMSLRSRMDANASDRSTERRSGEFEVVGTGTVSVES